VKPLSSFSAAAPAQPAQPAQAMSAAPRAATATYSANDPRIRRLLRSRAQTQKGFTRLSNSILREAIGRPLTRAQRAEIKAQTPKLESREIDKNIYRTPLARERSPKEMKARKRPEWTTCNFCLPRKTLEGLRLLAKAMAGREHQARIFADRGYRRRYPKTRNYYVLMGLNALFVEYGLSEFVVTQEEPAPGCVLRLAPSDGDEGLDWLPTAVEGRELNRGAAQKKGNGVPAETASAQRQDCQGSR
jgi:hypothetical protein